MAQQSLNGNRPKLSEKGLLTPDNCVVALIDHQGQMLFGTSNFDRQGIINNTVAFGKAARVFDVPVEAGARKFSSPAFGQRPALHCRPCRRFMTDTKSTSWKIAVAT